MASTKAVAILLFSATFALGVAGLGDPCAPACLHEHTGTYFPHPQNCTEFYQCSHLIAHIHTCPHGLYFNPTVNVCDYPEVAGCTADPEYDCEAPPPTTQPPVTTEGTTEAPDIGDPCAPDCTQYSSGTLVSHPQNCTLFFTCNHGYAYLHSCPSGLEFNPELEVCDFPSMSGCVVDSDLVCGAPTPPAPTTTESATEEVTDEPTTEEATDEPTTEEATDEPTTEEVTDEPTTEEATDEPTTEEVTDEPTTEEVTDEPTTEEATDEPTTEEATDAPTTDVVETTSAGRTTEGDCIPDCPSPNAIFADPRDCSKYFQCVDGVAIQQNCFLGLEYSPTAQLCTFGIFAGCTSGPDAPCVAVTKPPARRMW